MASVKTNQESSATFLLVFSNFVFSFYESSFESFVVGIGVSVDLFRAEIKASNVILERNCIFARPRKVGKLFKPWFIPQLVVFKVVEDEADSIIRLEVAA